MLCGCMSYLPILLALISCSNHSKTTADIKNKKPVLPNILVVMTDDQAQWASSVYGNSELETPNMEYLAATGVKFSRSYSISPVCSPSRASFFTGRLPSQHGVHDVLSENSKFDHDWLKGETFISEILKENGYATGLVGKWHSTTDCLPVHRGWDKWFTYNVHIDGWQNQYNHSGLIHYSDNGTPLSLEGFQSEHLTSEGIEFLEDRDQSKPFFLFMGYVDTHAPFSKLPERLVEKYRHSTFNDIPKNETSYLPMRNENSKIPENHTEQLAQYYAGVEFMDEQVGQLLDYLNDNDQLDNTLIIFTSDHGHLNGHHGLYGKGNATTPQNMYQESMLVPLIMKWHAGIDQQGITETIPVSQNDLFVTILDAAQIKLPQSQKEIINSPGRSVLSYLNNESQSWGDYQFSEFGNARMIVDKQYKFIQRLNPIKEGFGNEFFDLKDDPREEKNKINESKYEEQIKIMSDELISFFSKYELEEHSGTSLLDQPNPNPIPVWLR